MAERWREEQLYLSGCALSYRLRRIPGSLSVVFLPGVGKFQTEWEGQFSALADHTVLTMDLRLHGRSQPITLPGRQTATRPFSIPQAVEDLRYVLRETGLLRSVLVTEEGGVELLEQYRARFHDALGYGVAGERVPAGLEPLGHTLAALTEFIARCTPPPPAPVPELTVWERLDYWRTGLECGLFSLAEVEEALDQLFLEDTAPPLPLVEMAWQVTKGPAAFLHAIEEALFRRSWDQEQVLQAILERARQRWRSRQWGLQDAAACLSQLELPESHVLEYWLELLDVGYGDERTLLDLVLRSLRLPPKPGPQSRQEE